MSTLQTVGLVVGIIASLVAIITGIYYLFRWLKGLCKPEEPSQGNSIADASGDQSTAANVKGPFINSPVHIGPAREAPRQEVAARQDGIPVRKEEGWPKHCIRPASQTILDKFYGREKELADLQNAVAGGKSAICVVGMGGEGKSALLGRWYKENEFALKGKAVFWCRPYETGYTFTSFLGDILPYLDENYDARKYPTTGNQADYLCMLLRNKATIIVLDGVERWLELWKDDVDATGVGATSGDRAGGEEGLDTFLTDAATSWNNGSALIMTTRALPSALDETPVIRIEGLDDESAVKLLEKLGVKGESDEIRQAANEYENHALTLTVLGRLLKKEHSGDISKRPDVNPVEDDRQRRLERLLGKVEKHHSENLPLLDVISSCLAPASVEMLAAILDKDERNIRQHLSSLADWQLVRFDGKTAELHALMRQYFLSRLQARKANELRLRIAGWFASQPVPEQPQTLANVQPLLQATQHALAAGNVDLATDFLFGTPAGRHFETLSGWLDGFGYLATDIQLMDEVIEQYEHLVYDKGRQELRNDLAIAYNNRGNALGDQGKLSEAVKDFGKAIEICETLVHTEGRKELRNDLASAYNNRGNVLGDQGKLGKAVEDYGKAIEIRETLVNTEARKELRNDLALTYNNRGVDLRVQGKLGEAVEDFEKAIETYETLVHTEGRKELRNDLASAYNNRGNVLGDQRKLGKAVEDYGKAIEICETLVNTEARQELRNDLAGTYNNRGVALRIQGKLGEAVDDHGKAIEICETLVHAEGRKELRNDLAGAYNNRGTALAQQGKLSEALEDFGKAIETYKTLVHTEGRKELIGDLEESLFNRGVAYQQAGKTDAAEADMVQGAGLLHVAVEKDRNDLLPSFLLTAGVLSEFLVERGKAQEAAEWTGKAMRPLEEAVDAGRLTEVLQARAEGFFSRVEKNVEVLARAGLDVEVFVTLGRKLGIPTEEDEEEGS